MLRPCQRRLLVTRTTLPASASRSSASTTAVRCRYDVSGLRSAGADRFEVDTSTDRSSALRPWPGHPSPSKRDLDDQCAGGQCQVAHVVSVRGRSHPLPGDERNCSAETARLRPPIQKPRSHLHRLDTRGGTNGQRIGDCCRQLERANRSAAQPRAEAWRLWLIVVDDFNHPTRYRAKPVFAPVTRSRPKLHRHALGPFF